MTIDSQIDKAFEMAREVSQYLMTVAGAALAFLASIAHEPKSLAVCGSARWIFNAALLLLALSVALGCWTHLKFVTIYAGARTRQPNINRLSLRLPFTLQILLLLGGIVATGWWLLTQAR